MIKRWWRWLTNPNPMVGQVWDVDGVGLFRVVKITTRFPRFLRWLFSLGDGTEVPEGVEGVPVAGGDALRWPLRDFRSQAVLRPLTLRDVSAPPSLREVTS